MARQVETNISQECLKLLDNLIDNGYPIYYEHRSGSGGFNYKKGIPDMFIVINGMHVECEMKTDSGRRSPMQEKWAMKFERLGVKYICPKSFVEFRDYIMSLLKN